jgi:phosphopantetheinyl transferase
MGVEVETDCQRITVQTARIFHGRGPVFYASTACADQTPKGSVGDRTEDKHRLVSILWDHFAALKNRPWKHHQSSNRADLPIQVENGLLGKPQLLLGKERGPAVSFSTCGGKVWAALCGDESDLGIDAAGSDEFHSAYPYQRVFQPQEFQDALRLTSGNLEEASALLWSIKEAVVKALGCGFHFVDPRQITVHPPVAGGSGYTFPVGLSEKVLERFTLVAGQPLWVRSLLQNKVWFSIALANRKPTVHE